MMGQSHICDLCGTFKAGECPTCDKGERPDGFELGIFTNPYKEAEEIKMKINQGMKTTKQLFLEKCFGEFWEDVNHSNLYTFDQCALIGFLGCAERFNFDSDTCFKVSDRQRLEEAVQIIDNLEAAHDAAADERNGYQIRNEELRTENQALRGRIMILEGKR